MSIEIQSGILKSQRQKMKAKKYFWLVLSSLFCNFSFAECKDKDMKNLVRLLESSRNVIREIPRAFQNPDYSLEFTDRCYFMLTERQVGNGDKNVKVDKTSTTYVFNQDGELLHWKIKSLHGAATQCAENGKHAFISKSKESQLQTFKKKSLQEEAFKESKSFDSRRYTVLVRGCVVSIVEFLSNKNSENEFFRIWDLDRNGEIMQVGNLMSKTKIKPLSNEEAEKRQKKLDVIKLKHSDGRHR